MLKIQESLTNVRPIVDYLNDSQTVDEGLKDTLSKVKNVLGNLASRVITWAKGLVAQVQNWFMVVDEDGKILPCSTPLTMGNAWKKGLIDKTSTFVGMGKESGKLVGTSEPFSNAAKNYPDTLSVWRRIASKMTFESRNEEAFIQSLCESNSYETDQMLNEVRMANQDPQAKYNVICDDAMLAKLIKMHALNKQFSRLMIWGAPGIGKTAILNAVVKEIASEQGKDYSLIVKQLASETPDNFFLPKYTDDGRATDVPKTWMPVYHKTGDAATDAELDAKCGRGLLFIDELSRASQAVQNVLLPLINEGVLNGWYLGSGWSIICASNRMEDEESGGQTNIGAALGNRFSQVYYEPTCKTWKKWAEKQGFISPLLTQWLDMPSGESLAGGKFFYWDPNEEGDEDPTHLMCTPRSWTNAMQQLASFHNTGTLEGFNIFDLDEPIVKMILNNNVPAAAVDAFWAFLQTIRRIGNFDDAVNSAWKGNGSGLKIAPKDLVHVALPLSQLIITAHKDKLPTATEFKSLANWLVAANNEQLASYTLDVFKNVFGANVPDSDSSLGLSDLKSYIFFLKKMNDRKPEIWSHIHAFDEFMKVWGVDLKTMPDYSTGMAIIAKKYGDAFKNASVDGADGLG